MGTGNPPGRPRKKGPGGRPTKFTAETIQKLEDAFSMGCSDEEACLRAGIAPTILYTYQKKNPEFAEKKRLLKKCPTLKARMNIYKSIDSGDVDISKWYLERKNKDEFSTRTENTGRDGEAMEVKNITVTLVEPKKPNEGN